MKEELSELVSRSIALTGNCSGVYFLFDRDELVYVGQGWNCFLRVAEHTRKDSGKTFTSWNFTQIDDEGEQKNREREIRRIHKPKYNKV